MTFGVDTVVIVYGVAVTGVVVFVTLNRDPVFVLPTVTRLAVVGVPYVVEEVTTGFVGAVPVRPVWAGLGACGAVVGAHRFGHGRLGGPHGPAFVVAAAAHPAHHWRD